MWEQDELFKLRKRPGRCIQAAFFWDRTKWVSTHTENEDNAREWCRQYIIRTAHGDSLGNEEKVTLKQFAEDFFRKDSRGFVKRQERFGRLAGDATYNARQSNLDRYILPRFGSYKLEDIRPVEIEDWYVSLKQYKTGELLSSGSRKFIYDTFSIVMGEALRLGLIKSNPLDSVESIKVSYKKKPFFTETMLKKMFPRNVDSLIEIWGSAQYALYYSVAIDTGFRASEIQGLGNDCYDEKTHGVFTTRAVSARTNTIVESVKTSGRGYSYRVGFLSDRSVELLARIPEHCRNNYWFQTKEWGGAYYFIRYSVFGKHLCSVLRKLGFEKPEKYTMHVFRVTFMTRNENSISQDRMLELMGHTRYREVYSRPTASSVLNSLSDLRKSVVY